MSKDKTYRYIEPVQIRFNDIDGQQHVNNGIYQQYYDIGRAGYLTQISGTEYQTGGKSIVVASVQTDFLQPIFLHDKVQVETRVSKIGNKSITMEQRITAIDSGEVKSTCTTIFVGFNYDEQSSIKIPEDLRSMINAYEKGR
ncbi:MAG: thioesterase family protein [Spirochaetales bacterium]|uniref:Thioesterase family protein n=1 Tax=Candidatus Thalassospirochaeta sargassi TaxID=3119039 RepID=A0AAJ1IHV5_9SPIO|nr:thioesterase family protein [Spirochaetales bacterium]